MTFLATMNTPGYLPWDDDPPTFETAGDAWDYLAQQRREQEDQAEYVREDGADVFDTNSYYTDTVQELDAKASANAGPDTVYGHTIECDGDGPGCLYIAYNVTEVTDAESPA